MIDQKKKIICPECDGASKSEDKGLIISCKECNGKGYLEAVVVKQGDS